MQATGTPQALPRNLTAEQAVRLPASPCVPPRKSGAQAVRATLSSSTLRHVSPTHSCTSDLVVRQPWTGQAMLVPHSTARWSGRHNSGVSPLPSTFSGRQTRQAPGRSADLAVGPGPHTAQPKAASPPQVAGTHSRLQTNTGSHQYTQSAQDIRAYQPGSPRVSLGALSRTAVHLSHALLLEERAHNLLRETMNIQQCMFTSVLHTYKDVTLIPCGG